MQKSKTIKKELPQNQKIAKNGWKQGSFLLVDKKLQDKSGRDLESGFYIVVTQDCNLLNASFEKEPFAELVAVKETAEKQSQFIAGRNPRTLHFPVNHKQHIVHYECNIKDRYFIKRNHLEVCAPSSNYIDDKTKTYFISWIMKRYSRAAFPYSFNNRINKVKKKVVKLISEFSSDICDLYIQLSTFKELEDKEPYEIQLYILVKDEIKDQKISEIAVMLYKIVTLLEGQNIYAENDYRVVKLSDISYGRVLDLYQWDFEYLS